MNTDPQKVSKVKNRKKMKDKEQRFSDLWNISNALM